MKNKKTLVIMTCIVVAYLVLAIIFFGLDNFKDKIYSMNIVFSTGDKWHLEDGKWSDITNQNEYNWKKFNIYVDNELLGNYNLLYNKKWYIYDDNKNLINYTGTIIGINGNKKYEIIDFQESVFDSIGENLLKQILNEEDIVYSSLTAKSRYSLDIDDDNKKEDIYIVSNVFSLDETSKDRFSIIFIKDEEVQVLYQDYQDKSNEYNMCVPKLNSIIDFDKDSKYEIITECNYYSNMGSCTSLYELKNGKYELIKGC